MKQTAVEWLIDQVEDFITYIPTHISKQAKEMEKEQIIDAHSHGCSNGIQKNFITTQEYYNETFKSE